MTRFSFIIATLLITTLAATPVAASDLELIVPEPGPLVDVDSPGNAGPTQASVFVAQGDHSRRLMTSAEYLNTETAKQFYNPQADADRTQSVLLAVGAALAAPIGISIRAVEAAAPANPVDGEAVVTAAPLVTEITAIPAEAELPDTTIPATALGEEALPNASTTTITATATPAITEVAPSNQATTDSTEPAKPAGTAIIEMATGDRLEFMLIPMTKP